MREMTFTRAIDDALAQAMADDSRIIVFGEDAPMLRRNLLVRFGPARVRGTPISESAFLGAGVTAAMAGLRPVIEVYMVDFLGVCMDALLNHASKVEAFSGGNWNVPLVVRAPCGGGYGDGGQHGQSLWGWIAHIPGLIVVVPSNPADAGGLMTSAMKADGPVIFLEHKLLSEDFLEFLGSGGRKTVKFNVPPKGVKGKVPKKWEPVPFGEASSLREGRDLYIISLGVSVHRALEAAEKLETERISVGVLDIRTVVPLDRSAIIEAASKTGKILVVDEDYEPFGLSGEVAAVVMESGVSCKYARVCTKDTIPFARHLEDKVLPNTQRIIDAAKSIMK